MVLLILPLSPRPPPPSHAHTSMLLHPFRSLFLLEGAIEGKESVVTQSRYSSTLAFGRRPPDPPDKPRPRSSIATRAGGNFVSARPPVFPLATNEPQYPKVIRPVKATGLIERVSDKSIAVTSFGLFVLGCCSRPSRFPNEVCFPAVRSQGGEQNLKLPKRAGR